jgi:hypothetical protein
MRYYTPATAVWPKRTRRALNGRQRGSHMRRNKPSASVGLKTALLCLAGVAAGCSSQRTRMQVDVTQIAPYENAAKPPDCDMPVLDTMPLGTYKQVAIVEAWADLKDKRSDVLPALRRKACETGADALVILNSQHQDIKHELYQASPNEQLNEETESNVYSGQGDYIAEMEHTRRIGEAGHNGLYIDAVAINYGKAMDKSEASDPPAKARPNG